MKHGPIEAGTQLETWIQGPVGIQTGQILRPDDYEIAANEYFSIRLEGDGADSVDPAGEVQAGE